MNEIKATIKLVTGKKINLVLYPEVAPKTVENFVELCSKGFYDGLVFHRVIDGFMIQGGGFTDNGGRLVEKHAPRTVVGEFRANGFANGLSHVPGVISMARTSVPDSASSQFFICVADCTFLDGQYAAFGAVADEESLKTAVSIGKVKTHSVGYFDDVPVTPVVIQTIELLDDKA